MRHPDQHRQASLLPDDGPWDALLWRLLGELEQGKCPIEGGSPRGIDESGKARRCPLLSCRQHLHMPHKGHRIDERGIEPMLEGLVSAPYHCLLDFVADHQDGATEDEIAAGMGLSRQSVGDLLQRAERHLRLALQAEESGEE